MKQIQTALMLAGLLLSYCMGMAGESGREYFGALGGDGVVYLNWSAPAQEVSGYFVYRALPGEKFQRLNSEPIRKTFYADHNVKNGQLYWYKVRVVDHQGNEWQETKRIAAKPDVQSAPLTTY